MADYTTKLVIAAIDFGTTFSGYSYSFRHNLEKDKLKVYANIWTDENGKLQTTKAPTTVLFNPEGEFHSFGYEAEKTYAELADDDEHFGWKYFKHFKMNLHGKSRLSRTMQLRDDQGDRMLATKVFAAAIKFLKEQLFEQLTKKVDYIQEADIYWVVTVPAIWQYAAKQFMKEASLQAGIPRDQFSFALEPEAAAIYCKQYEAIRCEDEHDVASIQIFAPGSQFMVLDLGGGTVDITASEVQADGALKELYPPSGGPWGGTLVDCEIYHFFENVFGNDVWKQFKTKKKSDYLELAVTLELKKRQCKTKASTVIRIPLPNSLYTLYKEINDIDLGSDLSKRGFSGTVVLKKDKLCVANDQFVKLFENAKLLLLGHLKELFEKPELKNVSTMMMVGGFSESPIMHEAVSKTFPNKHVIIPEEAGTVVMKGAVMFGSQKEQIHSRKIPFSYGISTAVPFDPSKHSASIKMLNNRGIETCEDVFHKFVQKGQTVIPKKTKVQHSFMSQGGSNDCASVEVYQTPADVLPDPCFTLSPDFERIGELTLIQHVPGRQLIDVTMTFGDIELEVEAKEHGTDNQVTAKFDFMT